MFSPDMRVQVNKLYIRDAQSCQSVGRIYDEKFFNDNSNSVFMRIEDQNFESIAYLNDRCKTESSWFWIIIALVSFVVLLVILVPVIFCYFKRRRALDIVMPEPRTYRQTQIVMQVETHGLIKTDF